MKKMPFNLIVLLTCINATAQKPDLFFKQIHINDRHYQVMYMLMHQHEKNLQKDTSRQLTGKAIYKYSIGGNAQITDSAFYKYRSSEHGASFDFNGLMFSTSYSPYVFNIPQLSSMFGVLCDTTACWEWKDNSFIQCMAQYNTYSNSNDLSEMTITNHRCISDIPLSEKLIHLRNEDGEITNIIITEQSDTKTDTVSKVYYDYSEGKLLQTTIDTYDTKTRSWSADYVFTYGYDTNGNIIRINKWYCGVKPCLMMEYKNTYYPDNRLETIRYYNIDMDGELSLNSLDSFGYTGKNNFTTYWIWYERNMNGTIEPVEEIQKKLNADNLPDSIDIKSWSLGAVQRKKMTIDYSDKYPVNITVCDSLENGYIKDWYVNYYYRK